MEARFAGAQPVGVLGFDLAQTHGQPSPVIPTLGGDFRSRLTNGGNDRAIAFCHGWSSRYSIAGVTMIGTMSPKRRLISATCRTLLGFAR